MAGLRLTTLKVFSYIIKVWEELIALIKTSALTCQVRKKWWLPVFRFCLDLSVSNVYQLHRQQKRSEGERKLDLPGFRRSIVDTYYRYLRKSTTIFLPARKLSKLSDEVRHGALNHWISKGKQRRCASCQKTTLHFCEKCNVGLHPDSLKQFHTMVLWFYAMKV